MDIILDRFSINAILIIIQLFLTATECSNDNMGKQQWSPYLNSKYQISIKASPYYELKILVYMLVLESNINGVRGGSNDVSSR